MPLKILLLYLRWRWRYLHSSLLVEGVLRTNRSFRTILLQKSPLIFADQVWFPWRRYRVVRIMKLHSDMYVWNLLWNTALHLLVLGSLVEISSLNVVIHFLVNPHSFHHLSKSIVVCCCICLKPHWFTSFQHLCNLLNFLLAELIRHYNDFVLTGFLCLKSVLVD